MRDIRLTAGARRGDYRVIYAIDSDTVTIVRVDHRSDVYRPI